MNVSNNTDVTNKENKVKYVTFPFVDGLSDTLSRIFKQYQIEVVHTINKRLDCIIKCGKDVVPNDNKTGVVYRMNCINCDACYVGQTKRHLATRVREHRSAITKREGNWSVVSRHRASLFHDFEWSRVDILHREQHLRKREVAEMIFIKRHHNAINLQKDIENLPCVYDPILNNIYVLSPRTSGMFVTMSYGRTFVPVHLSSFDIM
ncbi:hypothetical protein X777_17025 [Ooceraea biroi]|uniref:GIY-YIG domain-containing protein n=1 Tax=Ooceraea biroi TaxID=2015173 RepID=A0A026VU32_OOCBI|nr:hypothetical protein X777_17025 [Ooceraea biroi]